MNYVCKKSQCSGCGACQAACPKQAITITSTISEYNALINESLCIDCNVCHNICPVNNNPCLVESIEWAQGWAENKDLWSNGSSGGVAGAIETSFVEHGGYVASCTFTNGDFIFTVSNLKDDIKKYQGSKYVKSNPVHCYKIIRELLDKNEKVLFVGLPCQVAGLKYYIGKKRSSNLYTVDIICHGTPSPIMLNAFLTQYNIHLDEISSISFRNKGNFSISVDNKALVKPGTVDCYSLAFLQGLTYTDNCYNCQYATEKRIADITLGDSWGNALAKELNIKGISLILIQTEKGKELLRESYVKTIPVDYRKAIEHNRQLREPSKMPVKRKLILNKLGENQSFNEVVAKCLIKSYLRQKIKSMLLVWKLK